MQLNADGLGAGSGMWHMASDQLDRYREAVDEDRPGTALEGIVIAARKAGLTVNWHEQLKTAPKGYAKDHPRINLLRYKGLITWKEWAPAAWLHTPRTGSWSSSGTRSRSTRGSAPTSVRRRCPSGGDNPPHTRGRSTSVNSA